LALPGLLVRLALLAKLDLPDLLALLALLAPKELSLLLLSWMKKRRTTLSF